ncbi:sulfurtransferase [Magnetococcus sp. PR-3]|uniref:sulfurtransferase n=1 Tax=Magnetococcus sp. PR-3 TaxID=3120355 RepID=UPI002FCE295F
MILRTLLFSLTLLFSASPVQAASALVDQQWLAKNQTQVTVLDVRPKPIFEKAHLPGAIWSDYHGDGWMVTRWGRPHMLAVRSDLVVLVGQLGLAADQHIVVVGQGGSAEKMKQAVRIYWTLKWLGHKELSLLDGGMANWSYPDKLVEGSPTPHQPVQYLQQSAPPILAMEEDTQDVLDNNAPPIDARPYERHMGSENAGFLQQAGSIWDAHNLPVERLLDKAGRFLSAKQMITIFNRHRVFHFMQRTVAFSDTGQLSSVLWFALYEVLGNKRAMNYDGGMVEWEDYRHDIWDQTDDMGGPLG